MVIFEGWQDREKKGKDEKTNRRKTKDKQTKDESQWTATLLIYR